MAKAWSRGEAGLHLKQKRIARGDGGGEVEQPAQIGAHVILEAQG